VIVNGRVIADVLVTVTALVIADVTADVLVTVTTLAIVGDLS